MGNVRVDFELKSFKCPCKKQKSFVKMSWSKFNDSLNNIKGQISTFIQENVVPDEEDEATAQTDLGLDQLQEVCAAQENEVNIAKSICANIGQDAAINTCNAHYMCQD